MMGKGNKKINKKDQDNTTAMHYAVRYNHLHIVKLLLDYGAGEESLSDFFFHLIAGLHCHAIKK